MSGRSGEIRLGVLEATPGELTQIAAWVADFQKAKARVEAITEIEPETFDAFFIVVGEKTPHTYDLGEAVQRAAFTPCLVLAACDDDQWVEKALAAGASDFLSMAGLGAKQLERALHFSFVEQRYRAALAARESCLALARERDRQKLANELHDGPLQDLIGARFLLGALGSSDATAEIQQSLQQVVQTVRSMCSELKPPALGPFGLEKAIRAHMQNFQTRHPKMDVTLDLDVDHQQLPEWARLALFRIFQAAVANVAQHAQASQVWVRFKLEGEQVRLTIADDGQGFVVPEGWLDFAATERCGLLMMQERVDALKGRMMVQSAQGGGTRVLVQVPLAQPSLPLPAILASAVPDRNG